MRRVTAFNFLSLDGYFEGPQHGDISWHPRDPEGAAYAAEMLRHETVMLFGRVTYELMAGFWPTSEAIRSDPVVAEGMNRAEKIVFSRTLQRAGWNNTRILKENIVEEIRKMKASPGRDMTVLGSGTIVSLFAEHHLIDEFQIMLDPVVLGRGTSLFHGIRQRLQMKLTGTKTFRNGSVLLSYQPLFNP